jgi:hypothetical protein
MDIPDFVCPFISWQRSCFFHFLVSINNTDVQLFVWTCISISDLRVKLISHMVTIFNLWGLSRWVSKREFLLFHLKKLCPSLSTPIAHHYLFPLGSNQQSEIKVLLVEYAQLECELYGGREHVCFVLPLSPIFDTCLVYSESSVNIFWMIE